MELTFTLDTLSQAAAEFAQQMGDQRVFAFYGQMGAGKTTFIKALCEHLGVTEGVNSPTFAIINEYASPEGPVYHFDFYRLKSETEAFDIGSEDYFYSGCYCFIEWPEKIQRLLPEEAVAVHIDRIDDQVRRLSC